MTRAGVKFKQCDVVRAIRAAKAAGEPVAGIEIDPDGRIKVMFGEQTRGGAAAEKSEADRTVQEWLKKRGLG